MALREREENVRGAWTSSQAGETDVACYYRRCGGGLVRGLSLTTRITGGKEKGSEILKVLRGDRPFYLVVSAPRRPEGTRQNWTDPNREGREENLCLYICLRAAPKKLVFFHLPFDLPPPPHRFKRCSHNHQQTAPNVRDVKSFISVFLSLPCVIYTEATCSISSQIRERCDCDLICKDRYVPGEMPDQSYSFRGSLMRLFSLSVLTNNVFVRVSSTPHAQQ